MIVKVDTKDRLVQEAVREKVCTRCRETKPVTEFTIDRTSKDGFSYRCRGCQSKYDKELRARRKAAIATAAAASAPTPAPFTVAPTSAPLTVAPTLPVANGVQPAARQPQPPTRNGEILAAVSMLLEMEPADCAAVMRMVSAFFDQERGAA